MYVVRNVGYAVDGVPAGTQKRRRSIMACVGWGVGLSCPVQWNSRVVARVLHHLSRRRLAGFCGQYDRGCPCILGGIFPVAAKDEMMDGYKYSITELSLMPFEPFIRIILSVGLFFWSSAITAAASA